MATDLFEFESYDEQPARRSFREVVRQPAAKAALGLAGVSVMGFLALATTGENHDPMNDDGEGHAISQVDPAQASFVERHESTISIISMAALAGTVAAGLRAATND